MSVLLLLHTCSLAHTRRYSQIAALATKLHFHPTVGLPPKYALQVFPLTEEQLKQRFDGLQAFIGHVFMHLHRELDDGAHHDVNSTAGLDMQIFYDFVAHHRNRPPAAVRSIPEWAKPTVLHGATAGASGTNTANGFPFALSRSSSSVSGSSLSHLDSTRSRGARRSTWRDVDSITDSEDVGMGLLQGDRDDDETDDGNDDERGAASVDESKREASDRFRNELLQAEGNLNALWNCVKAYSRATHAWWVAASAVADEYKRVGDMPLFHVLATPASDLDYAPVTTKAEAATSPTQDPAHSASAHANMATDGAPPHPRLRRRSHRQSHSTRLASTHRDMVERLEPAFRHQCDDTVLAPLEALVRDVLPEVKHSYWTRLSSGANGSADNVNVRRLVQERDALQRRIEHDVQASMAALVALQNELLAAVQTTMQPFESVEMPPPAAAAMASRQSSAAAPEPDASRPTAMITAPDNSDASSGALENEASVSSGDKVVASPTSPALTPMTPTSDVVVAKDASTDASEQDENAIRNGQDMTSRLATTDNGDGASVAGVDDSEDNEDGDGMESDNEPLSRVWVWGRPPTVESGTPLVLRPKQVALLNGQSIIQVACGGEHLLYLTDTGDVYSFGDHDDRRAAAAAAAGKRGAAASSFLAPRLVEAFALEKALHRTKIVKVACGAQHSVGITEVGELYTWGSGEDGRLGHGDMRDRTVPRKVMSLLRERVVHASCGGAHTAVLTDKSKVFTFGRGRNGRLGLGDNKWRDTPHEVTAFGRDAAVVHVVCGWNFTAALGRDGSVYSWGKQGEGQCGLGYLDKDQLVPRNIEKLLDTHVVDIACGYTHTLALTARGEVYSWGLGEYGQLGRGIVYQPVPEAVDLSAVLGASDRIDRVYCGAFHSVVTTQARVMYAWGLNMYGACGLGHTANKDTPDRIDSFSREKELVVACGHKYTIALEVDQDAVVPPHKVHLSATQPRQLVRAADGTPFSLPPPLNLSVISATTNALEWTAPGNATTPTNGSGGGDSGTPKISYHVPGVLASETRETMHEREEELRRAKKLWRTRILRDWEENKDTPLAHSMWRQGIPPSIRAKVWPLAIGNRLKITPDMYWIYRRRAVAYKQEERGEQHGIGREHTLALIDTDLPRTFPTLKLFDASGPYYAFLLEVLETYACYRPDLGYIQGMSYLAAMLCLHMPQDRYLTFQCLANLMVHEHLFTFYLLDAELSGVYYTLFDAFLRARVPQLHRHLEAIGVSCSMYLMNWLQTLFLQVLPLELAARVFDNFLLDGTVFLFRTAMAIHELLLPDLLAMEIDEAMPSLQKNPLYHDLWCARVSEDALFHAIAAIAVPSHIYAALDRVVNDVFFYDKRTSGGSGARHRLTTTATTGLDSDDALSSSLPQHARGGQSVGIGRVKHERRRMYSISDTLNGVLGGF